MLYWDRLPDAGLVYVVVLRGDRIGRRTARQIDNGQRTWPGKMWGRKRGGGGK